MITWFFAVIIRTKFQVSITTCLILNILNSEKKMFIQIFRYKRYPKIINTDYAQQ